MTLTNRERRLKEMILPMGSGWNTVPRSRSRSWHRPHTLSGTSTGLWKQNRDSSVSYSVYPDCSLVLTLLMCLQCPAPPLHWPLVLQYWQPRLGRLQLQLTSAGGCWSTWPSSWSTLLSMLSTSRPLGGDDEELNMQ